MEIHRITSTGDALFTEAMRLYAESFPAHEQREAPSQRRILGESAYHFNAVCDNGEFIGEALCWEVGEFLYIEHLCVLPSMRNRGYGQKILDALRNTPLILEIDPPVDAISMRRKGFYERCGFVANPYRHVHPPYHKGNHGHELVVMSRPRMLTDGEYDRFRRYLQDTVMHHAFE